MGGPVSARARSTLTRAARAGPLCRAGPRRARPLRPRRGRRRRRRVHLLLLALAAELGEVLLLDRGQGRVEGGLVLDDGDEDAQELRVHVWVGKVARRRKELLAIALTSGACVGWGTQRSGHASGGV